MVAESRATAGGAQGLVVVLRIEDELTEQ